MIDRELLEAAAKAAGIVLYWPDDATFDEGFALPQEPLLPNPRVQEKRDWLYWNPLTDDGDALRLGAKLNMFDEMAKFQWNLSVLQEKYKDPAEAVRRAIVETAAEIERAKP